MEVRKNSQTRKVLITTLLTQEIQCRTKTVASNWHRALTCQLTNDFRTLLVDTVQTLKNVTTTQ